MTQTIRQNNLAKHITNRGYEVPPDRCTGKTTSLIHCYIWLAYAKPSEWIKVRDHHDANLAHRDLTRRIRETIEVLGYDHFEFRQGEIRFNLYSERKLKTITVDGVKYQEVI